MFLKTFDSIDAMARYADTATCAMPESARSSRSVGREAFSGVGKWSAALDLARRGWPEGCSAVDALTTQLFAQVMDRMVRPEIVSDVSGDMIDMGSYCEGRPDCWFAMQPGDELTTGSQTLTIVADVSASAGIPKDVIYLRGAALTALVASLELAGRPCEVVVAANSKDLVEVRATVKRAGDPLQIDALAFSLAHAAMLRRLVFAVWETAPKRVLRACGIYPNTGYGRVRETTGTRGDIYLPPAALGEPQWGSLDAARVWVLARLREQGVAIAA